MSKHIWTTKDGKKIPIEKMSDVHLMNAIQMLIRRHEEDYDAAYSFAASCQGEMASYYAYGEAENIQASPWIRILQTELERRGMGWMGEPLAERERQFRGSQVILKNLERCCQLHEEVTIIYVVDGYQARLTTDDSEIVEVFSESLDDILLKLDASLEGETLESIRRKVPK